MFNGGKLRRRIVIDANTAERIGYVSDIEIDEVSGRVTSIIIRRSHSFLCGVFNFGQSSIPWHLITAMSEEYVLVKTFDFGEKYLKNQ